MSQISRSLNKILALVIMGALLLAACAPREAGTVEETRAAVAASDSTLYMEVVGLLEALGDDSATVGGTRLRVNNTTQVAEGLATNQLVEAQTVLGEDGLAALAIRQAADGQPVGQTFALSGAVENIGSSTWTVGGHTVRVETGTVVSGGPAIGDLVTVQGSAAANGALVARSIAPGASAAAPVGAEIEFVGVVTSIGASQWVIGGQSVNVTSATEIKPGVALGTNVKVHATPQTDGSLLAREIELAPAAGDGTATPRAGNEQEFTGPLTAISGDLWTIGGVQMRITSGTEVKGTLQIGDVLKVHASPGSDGVLVAREVELAAGDDDDNDDDDDGNGNEQEFTGTLSAINGDLWTVGGRQVRITSGTEVKGSLQIGDVLKVHASPGGDGVLVAREVERADADDLNDDDNGDDDDNSGSGNGDDEGNDDDNSGSGNSDDDDNDDNSGSGNGGNDSDDDNSGSGGGGDDDDDNGDDDDNSGSGSGGDDSDDDNSGSGGGGDDDGDDDNSGSGGGDDDD